MRRSIILIATGLGACGPDDRSAARFATDRPEAERVAAACDAGEARHDCEAARQGLAEARHRDRIAAYRQAL